MVPVYLWQAARSWSWVYFSAVNPAVPWGGAFGVSKYEVLRRLPRHVVPPTVLAQPGQDPDVVLRELDAQAATHPRPLQGGEAVAYVAKPDWGERGQGVTLLPSREDARRFLGTLTQPYVIQAYAPGPLEFGILWSRQQNEPNGRVTSLMQRGFLSVKGDGHHTVAQLMAHTPRAAYQLGRLAQAYPGMLDEVPPAGTERMLEPIGNHSRGTTFHTAMHLDARRLVTVFDALMANTLGLDYGRFDLRCASLEDLYAARFWVVELNGVASEPAHIYQPGFGLWRAWRVLAAHWVRVGQMGRANHRAGTPYAPLGAFIRHWRVYRKRVG